MSTPEDELEVLLRRAMHSEADATRVSPDALVRIRGRVAPPKKSRAGAGWLRPAAAASGLAFTLVAGTLVGVKLSGNDGGGDTLAEPPPVVLIDPAASSAPHEPEAENPAPKTSKTPEHLPGFDPARTATPVPMGGDPSIDAAVDALERTHKIPEDTGGSYVAITGPDSGLTVGRRFELTGLARVFEANVIIEVSQNGKVVKRDFTTASTGAPEKGTWTKVLVLEPGAYRIDAFEESMEGNGKRLASDTIWLTVADDPQSATKAEPEASEPQAGDAEEPAAWPGATGTAAPQTAPDPMTGQDPDPAAEPVAAGEPTRPLG